MSNSPSVPQELQARISVVRNKRARLVLDTIVQNGSVTTEELQKLGYTDPRRAAQDVKDLGFGLKSVKVKHSNGRSIAAYQFSAAELDPTKTGRKTLSKKERTALIKAGGNKCNVCSATHNLQVDHRIPFEVAAETQRDEANPFQVLDGSCNRKKSWSCEHCKNLLEDRHFGTCLTCYWANPEAYTHVAMVPERRVDIVWAGNEIDAFKRLSTEATRNGRSVADQIKTMLKTKMT